MDPELSSAVSEVLNLILGFANLLVEAANRLADCNRDKMLTENDKTDRHLAVMTNGEWIRSLYLRFYK